MLIIAIAVLCFPAMQSHAEKAKGHYSHTNSKGKTYYLFAKDIKLKNSDKVRRIYFFAKDPNNKKGIPLAEVPADRVVSETKTGMLVLKKKRKRKSSSKNYSMTVRIP